MINNKFFCVPQAKKKLPPKRNLKFNSNSNCNLISESLSMATATSTATLLPQCYHELADSFSSKNINKSRNTLKVNCFQKTCFTSELKNKTLENDENYLINNLCNLNVISNHNNSKFKRTDLDKEQYLNKHKINSEYKKNNLKKSNLSSQQHLKDYSSNALFFLNNNCSKFKNNKFVDKISFLNNQNKSSSLSSNNKQSSYQNNSKFKTTLDSRLNGTVPFEMQQTINATSVDSNNTFLPSKIAQISSNLCITKWKQLTKGFNSKDLKISDRLNINSKNCIEKLLLHEQCKNLNSDKNLNDKPNFKIKTRFNKIDENKEEHNITETMKSVDYKDLNLLQMLTLKSFDFNTSETPLTSVCENDCTSESNKKINRKHNLRNKNFLFSFENNDQNMESTMLISNNLTNNNFKSNFYMANSDVLDLNNLNLDNKNVDELSNDFDEVNNESKSKNKDYNKDLNLLTDHKCNTSEYSDLSKINSSNSNWIQIAGHQNSFASPMKPGKIWKRNQINEYFTYKLLNESNELIVEFLPKFYSVIKTNEGQFIEIEDLLSLFTNPSLMDIKMGYRTFLETDFSNSCARPDLYEKLIKIDQTAATQDEHQSKAITKFRYMTFRENLSSSSTLGFRIEAFKCKCTEIVNDFYYLRKETDVKKALKIILPLNKNLKNKLLKKLKLLKLRFKESNFFKNHEVIGSSLLIIYDDEKIGVWMIDFAKTVELPEGIKINHESNWNLGNHEDGYLTGLNNLISMIKEIS